MYEKGDGGAIQVGGPLLSGGKGSVQGMKGWQRIDVRAYGGIKDIEKPREVLFGDHNTVVKVLSDWLEEDIHSRGRRHYFRVISIETGREYLLCLDLDSREWFGREIQ